MGNRYSAENSNVDDCYIWQLPNEILVEIFSYLGPGDHGRCAQVCKHWHQLVNDEPFWRYGLLKCHKIWKFDTPSDQLPDGLNVNPIQEIYDPNNEVNSRIICWMRQKGFCPLPANNNLRPIRLLFFGLGIAANRISRTILTGQNNSFQALELTPGNEKGFGGGVIVKFKARHFFLIITQYTNVKAVRENPNDPVRTDLFAKWLTTDKDQSETLNQEIKRIIHSVDGFVYSTMNDFMHKDAMWLANAEKCLRLIMDEAALVENSQCRRPILHLSCSTGVTNQQNDVNFIDRLHMKQFPRPWNICKVDLDRLTEIEQGFNWLTYVALKQQNMLKY
ncbi:F-box protein 4 [Chamberlinius hualienensis]